MSFKSFKKYTILLLFAIGVTACTDMTGDQSNKTARPVKFGKTFRQGAKPSRRGTDLAARTLLGGSSNLFASSFFSMGNGSGNLWDRMRDDFQLPNYENQPAVRAQIQWFLNNQGYLNRTINRAVPYMYYIFEQVQQRHLPGELVLLPVIESAYNPFVRSAAGASGLWQLMPGTARGFGVRQNFWFDGRRDIYASTNAALDYLTYLWNYFGGDWLLAIAAYDTGEGNVQNAIRRSAARDQSTVFWSLPLAAETRSYVPRLLALAAIIRNPGKYGITLPKISDKPYLEQVRLDAPIKLNHAAKLADLSLSELKQLNPGYSRNTTDPTGPHQLTLPVDRIALFKERLMNVQSNMTLLAQTDEEPAEAEQAVIGSAKVAHESSKQTAKTSHKSAAKHVVKTKKTVTTRHYTVRPGDSLGKVASKFGMNVATLKRINHLKSDALKPGQRLIIQ
jgi:membrane-bound lytic murein transglycosylase D